MIKSDPSARFLGVMMDKALGWKEQHARMVKRGQDWITQFRRLSRMKDGMVAQHIRQLYKSKALTRMLYAADVVLVPRNKRGKGEIAKQSQIVRKLTSIQRQAALMISGAMKTTASDILDIHSALLPMNLEIERQRQRAAVRLTTLSDTHPLASRIHSAARNSRRRRHFSPLHDLMHAYQLKPKRIEKKKAVRFAAEWDPYLEIRIFEDEDEARKALQEDDADVKVFSDGSGYKGGVGAAAVMYEEEEETQTLRFRLGSEDDHEVYDGTYLISPPSATAPTAHTKTINMARQYIIHHCL